jgi:hypothetical protein
MPAERCDACEVPPRLCVCGAALPKGRWVSCDERCYTRFVAQLPAAFRAPVPVEPLCGDHALPLLMIKSGDYHRRLDRIECRAALHRLLVENQRLRAEFDVERAACRRAAAMLALR